MVVSCRGQPLAERMRQEADTRAGRDQPVIAQRFDAPRPARHCQVAVVCVGADADVGDLARAFVALAGLPPQPGLQHLHFAGFTLTGAELLAAIEAAAQRSGADAAQWVQAWRHAMDADPSGRSVRADEAQSEARGEVMHGRA